MSDLASSLGPSSQTGPLAEASASGSEGAGHTRQGIGPSLTARANLIFSRRLRGIGVAITIIPIFVLGGSVWHAGAEAQKAAEDGAMALVRADLDHVAQLADLSAKAFEDDLRRQLTLSLAEARVAIKQSGLISLEASSPVTWKTRNQFTLEEGTAVLPAVLLGGRPIGQNDQADIPTPIVDGIRPQRGGATIFQRINDAGDMLRVATTILNGDGPGRSERSSRRSRVTSRIQ